MATWATQVPLRPLTSVTPYVTLRGPGCAPVVFSVAVEANSPGFAPLAVSPSVTAPELALNSRDLIGRLSGLAPFTLMVTGSAARTEVGVAEQFTDGDCG